MHFAYSYMAVAGLFQYIFACSDFFRVDADNTETAIMVLGLASWLL